MLSDSYTEASVLPVKIAFGIVSESFVKMTRVAFTHQLPLHESISRCSGEDSVDEQ